MFYIIALTLLVLGAGGLMRVWLLKRRRERIYHLLEQSSQQYALSRRIIRRRLSE